MLYAPENKDGIPTELDNRLLKLFIEDNKAIREAIGRKEAGHDNITVKGLDYEYIYDTTDLQNALRAHYRELPTKKIKKGDSTSIRGASYAKLQSGCGIRQRIFSTSKLQVLTDTLA